MKKFDSNAFAFALAKRFGIDVDNEDAECDSREGIVYVQQESGALVPLAWKNREKTIPIVSSCTHNGVRMVLEFVEDLMPMILLAELLGGHARMPKPEHFTFVYQDEAEEKLLELESVGEADAVINFVKGL